MADILSKRQKYVINIIKRSGPMTGFCSMCMLETYHEGLSAGPAETKGLSDKLRLEASGEDREGNRVGESLMTKAMARTLGLCRTGTSSECGAGEGDKVKALAGGPGFRRMPNLTEKWLNGPVCPRRFR
uniref:Uncharacterized protein n=1 Tax=Oryza glaberrima TaxID=4538 RepID=I1PJ80_ORYGL